MTFLSGFAAGDARGCQESGGGARICSKHDAYQTWCSTKSSKYYQGMIPKYMRINHVQKKMHAHQTRYGVEQRHQNIFKV